MRGIPLQIKNILKEVAEELNEPYEIVEKVYYHQFEFLRDCIEKGEKNNYPTFENVLLKHLGTFFVNEKRFEHIVERSKKNGRS